MMARRVTYGVWVTAAFVTVALFSLGIGLLTGLAQQPQPRETVKVEPGAHCPAGDVTTRPEGAASNIRLTPSQTPVTISAWMAT